MIASGDRLAAAAIAIAIAIAPRASIAAPAPSDAEIATARALYRDAVLLERQGRNEEALARLEAAFRTVKTPVLALEMAKLEVQLGHPGAAYETLRALDEIPSSAHETDKSRDARHEAAALAASLREKVGTLRVVVPTDLEGAMVKIDGAPIVDPESVTIDPGSHAIVLAVAGKECAQASVAVQEGESRVIDLRDRAAACAPPPPAREPDPPATTASPLASRALPPPIDPPKTEGLSTAKWIALGLAGAGGLSAAIGGYVAIRAKADYDAVAADCVGVACTPYAYDVRQAARARATGATYAIVLGLGSIGAGVTLWLIDGEKDRANAHRVGVALSTSGAALTITTP